MFGKIGIMELIVILIIALLIFGPKRLPQVGGAIGGAIREFKKGAKDIQNSFDADTEEPATIKPAETIQAEQPVELKAEPLQKAEISTEE